MDEDKRVRSKGLSTLWVVALLALIPAAVPLLIFGGTEVHSMIRMGERIREQNLEAAHRLTNLSAFALKQKSIAEITQLLSDKAASVDRFFRDMESLLGLLRTFALRAWEVDTPAPRGTIIPAAVMRDPARLPPDAKHEKVRNSVISFVAPMVSRPPSVPAAVEKRAWPKLERLGFEMKSIHNQDDRVLFAYMGTVEGILICYPADTSLKPTYDPRTRPWYRKAVAEDALVWTPPYADAGTGVMVMTCAAPVKVKGKLVGVVALDVRLDRFIRQVLTLQERPAWSVALINKKGDFITPPSAGRASVREGDPAAGVFGAETVGRVLKGHDELFEYHHNNRDQLAGAKTIPTVGWIMMVTVPSDVALELSRNIEADFARTAEAVETRMRARMRLAVERLVTTGVLLAFIALLMAILVGSMLGRQMRRMADMAEEVARGDFAVRTPVKGSREMRSLARAFNTMAGELSGYTERIAHEAAERQRIDTELKTAREVQSALIPRRYPPMPRTDIHAVWRPAKETAGDFYDVFELPNGLVGLVMADVSGKGLGAAVFMTMTRALLHSYARASDSPSETLRKVNAALAADEETGMFVTAIYAVYEPSTGRIAIANAGHLPPLVVRDGECVWQETAGGPPLAVMEFDYATRELTLDPGDLFFLYTDGVTEAMDPEGRLFTDDRLMDLARAHPDLSTAEWCIEVLHAVDTWAAGATQSDDVCLLAIRRKKGGGEDSGEVAS